MVPSKAYGYINWDALFELVPFVQLKKREKHSRRSVTFNKASACKFEGHFVFLEEKLYC